MIDKTTGDIGSIVPLNINQRAIIPTTMVKSEPFIERVERAARAGTPPTRRGAFHGVMPSTQPGLPAEYRQPLMVSKAVVNPEDAGTGSGDSAQRKRDPGTGKFTQRQNAGPLTTAKDDLAAQQRTARLAERHYLKSMGMPDQQSPFGKAPQGPAQVPPAAGQSPGQQPQQAAPKPENPMSAAGIPGAPPGQGGVQMGAGADQAMGEQPLGQAPDGTPIFADPYNQAHSSFTPDQHQAAAELHQQMAEQMTGQGRIPTAMEHQMKAAIHGEMGRDAMSPMARMAMDQQGVQGLSATPGQVPELTGAGLPPGAGGPNSNPAMGGQAGDAMDQFLTNLPDQIPGGQNRPGGPNDMPNGPQDVAGPEPRMTNTYTGGPIGPLTPPQDHAGTMAEPQAIPEGPPPGAGSMPQIGGGQDDGMSGMAAVMPNEQAPGGAPTGGEPDGDEGMPGPGDGDGDEGLPGQGDGDGDEDDETGPGLEESGLQSGDSFSWDPSAFEDEGDGGEGDASPQDDDGPTPGASESEPGKNAGPSTEDKPPRGAAKSFSSWFATV